MPTASHQLELGRSKDPPSKPYNVRQFPLLSNFVGKGSDATRPPQSELSLVQLPLRFASVDKGSDVRERTGPPQPPLRSAAPPAQLRWQGERCTSNDISQYKQIFRVYRMNVCRVGPCVRPKSSYISDKWSLLSKGLRGGKSRSDRVESL